MQIVELVSILESKGPTLTETALEEFEREIGDRLPDDYREFLLECNGGVIARRNDGVLHHPTTCPVDSFWGLHEDRPGARRSLRCWFQLLRGRLPEGLLEISSDPFGNPLCIGLSESCRGRICYFLHEEEYQDPDWDGRIESLKYISFVADSFTEFVAGLHFARLEDVIRNASAVR
jgi:hypothetical protein